MAPLCLRVWAALVLAAGPAGARRAAELDAAVAAAEAEFARRGRRRMPLAVAAAAVIGATMPVGVDAFPLRPPMDTRLAFAATPLSGPSDSEWVQEGAPAMVDVTSAAEPVNLEPEGEADDEPYWMPALRALSSSVRAKFGGRERFEGPRRGIRGRRTGIEVIEVKSHQDRIAAWNALQAYDLCGGGDIVRLVKTASNMDGEQMVLPLSTTDAGAVFLLTEAADGDLLEVLQKRGSASIPTATKLRILVEVLRGLRKMEAAGFIHRSVDPRNLIVDGECASGDGCDVMLGGLAHARPYQDKAETEWFSLPGYIAPEVWAGTPNHRKADVWSVGVLAYMLFVGAMPKGLEGYGSDAVVDLRQHPLRDFVMNEFDVAVDEPLRELERKDAEVAKLIRGMLRRNVVWRPSIRRALRKAQRIAKSRGVAVPERADAL